MAKAYAVLITWTVAGLLSIHRAAGYFVSTAASSTSRNAAGASGSGNAR